jgi:lysozyme family protein
MLHPSILRLNDDHLWHGLPSGLVDPFVLDADGQQLPSSRLIWYLVKYAHLTVVARASHRFLGTLDHFGLDSVVRTSPSVESAIACVRETIASSKALVRQSAALALRSDDLTKNSDWLVRRSLEQAAVFFGRSD